MVKGWEGAKTWQLVAISEDRSDLVVLETVMHERTEFLHDVVIFNVS